MPSETLEQLKRDHFTELGREERIARSLEALNAPSAIELSLAEWKEILEDANAE